MAPLLDLLTDIAGARRVERVRSRLCLPAVPLKYELRSDRVLTMLFAARAGSTFAGQLIAQHPHFTRSAEWFHPVRLENLRDRPGLSDDGEALQAILNHQARQALSVECTAIGLISSALLGFLDQMLPRTVFFLLRRRDTVAQAVSLHRARLTGQYSSGSKSSHEVRAADYDREAIANHLRTIERVYAIHQRFLAAIGCEAPTYFYEDVVADPDGFRRGVYALAGLPPGPAPAAPTGVRKQADAINRLWIDRFKEETGAS